MKKEGRDWLEWESLCSSHHQNKTAFSFDLHQEEGI
jgi:hypothetical protein